MNIQLQLDTDKMPLGKLSKKQIKSGYKVLTEVLKHIEKNAADKNAIIDATNRRVVLYNYLLNVHLFIDVNYIPGFSCF